MLHVAGAYGASFMLVSPLSLGLCSARLELTLIAPQRFLLAEIIKTSKVSIDTLLGIIKKEHIEPDWNEIFIPPGKSLWIRNKDRYTVLEYLYRV